MTETFDLSLAQAEAYEEHFVPAIFGQWAPLLVDLAEVGPGHRVLDVACGTGVVAREAAARTGDPGAVVGVDLNPAMLEVARRIRPDIGWQRGDAAALPCRDREFDRVFCQSALFFFADAEAALAEMARVVERQGIVAVQTYALLADQPGYRPFVETVVRHVGQDARSLLGLYWSWGDLAGLRRSLGAHGLDVHGSRTELGIARFRSLDDLIRIEVGGTPLADRVTDRQTDAIRADLADALGGFVTPAGTLDLPIRAHLVAATRR